MRCCLVPAVPAALKSAPVALDSLPAALDSAPASLADARMHVPPLQAQEVDLQDEANVMASPGLLEYAVSHGLYNPGSGQPFNFQKAFMRDDPAIDPRINYHRVCQLQRLFAGSSAGPVAIGAAGEEEAAAAGAGPACGPQRPAFMKPERKLGVRDVFAGLRDQYEGTIHDM